MLAGGWFSQTKFSRPITTFFPPLEKWCISPVEHRKLGFIGVTLVPYPLQFFHDLIVTGPLFFDQFPKLCILS